MSLVRSTAVQARAFTRVAAGRKAVMSVVAEDKKAVCVLTGTAGVEGTVTFTQSGDGPTKIVGDIKGLAAGMHGKDKRGLCSFTRTHTRARAFFCVITCNEQPRRLVERLFTSSSRE